MNYKELNDFIFNYLKNDKTNRAIMLTGEWGNGKSYFINEILKDDIEKRENGQYKCVVVSLYGLKKTSEISESIYAELRTMSEIFKSQKLKAIGEKINDSEVVKTVFTGLKVLGKSVLNLKEIELASADDKDLQELYESINLDKKLIVLEDVERTDIQINELLGYVNNLCERNGVKVLLVANENEIVKYDIIFNESENGNATAEKVLTEKSKEYLKTKEKAICDTIRFKCDYRASIKQIIEKFAINIEKYTSSESIDIIVKICDKLNSHNLRQFIYACQKSSEIIGKVSKDILNGTTIPEYTEQTIFYGIVAFTQRQCGNPSMQFETGTYASSKLGFDEKYPLFRFCYDYITAQRFDNDSVKCQLSDYRNYRLYSKWNSGQDSDLKVLREYYINNELTVISAIKNISAKIWTKDIPYWDYGTLLCYLYKVRWDVGIECDNEIKLIERSILQMIKNENDKSKINFNSLFNVECELKTKSSKDALSSIKNEIESILNFYYIEEFTYEQNKLEEYYNKNAETIKASIRHNGFAIKLDVEKFAKMLENCSSYNINVLCALFRCVYENYILKTEEMVGTVTEKKDLTNLRNLVSKIESHIYGNYDKVQKFQIERFKNILIEICNKVDTEMDIRKIYRK